MRFDPFQFAIKRQFGSEMFYIRPAQVSDRDLVWNAYKNAPKDFFYHITEITKEMLDNWYPIGGTIDYDRTLPFNAMRLDEHKEIEFAGNVTFGIPSNTRFNHTAMMGLGVLPKFQGQGLGSFLVELILKIARAKPGLARLELQVCAGNKRARKLYAKFGFEEEGLLRKRWIYPNGKIDDVIVMSILFPEKMRLLSKQRIVR
ncbi:MAG: GNAT family N-acetyltransferase [Promethearchaeota archaeon]